MTRKHRYVTPLFAAAAVGLALAAGALSAPGKAAWKLASPADARGPAASTPELNQRYTACIRANGATWTLMPESGLYRVDIPAAANARCAGLDLAREAAGFGDARTAEWLAKIQTAPASFWGCVGAAGYHTPGGTGQRSDYGTAAFRATARSCASSAGISLPAGQ